MAGVDKWRDFVRLELDRADLPLPTALVLAHMASESGGKVGDVNPRSGASGLMHVMPIALRQYNRDTRSQLTMDDMRGTDPRSAQLQVRVGLHILGMAWESAFAALEHEQRTVPISELVRCAALIYVGGGRWFGKLLKRAKTPTWASIAAIAPARPASYAQKVWHRTKKRDPKWKYDAMDSWLQQKAPTVAKRDTGKGLFLGLLVLGLASKFFRSSGKGKGKGG